MSKKSVKFSKINEVHEVPRKSPNSATWPSAENLAVHAARKKNLTLTKAQKMAANLARQVAQNGGSPNVFYNAISNFAESPRKKSPPRSRRSKSASPRARRSKSASPQRTSRSVGVGTNNVSASTVLFPGVGRKLTNPVKALWSKSIHAATRSARSALRNATIVGKALIGEKSARTKYTESILEYEKQLKAIKENEKLKQRINAIVNNAMRQLTTENARKTHAAKKEAALRKLKNNLKASRNLLSPTHHAAYNKYARVLIKNTFEPLFNSWALSGDNLQAIESMEKSTKEAIAALINLNKKQKEATAAYERSAKAVRTQAQLAERNRMVRTFRELQAKQTAEQAAANAAARLRRQVDKMVEEAEKFEKPAKQTGYRPGVYKALTTTQKRSGSLVGIPRKTNKNKTN
jgi:hypothetical protein